MGHQQLRPVGRGAGQGAVQRPAAAPRLPARATGLTLRPRACWPDCAHERRVSISAACCSTGARRNCWRAARLCACARRGLGAALGVRFLPGLAATGRLRPRQTSSPRPWLNASPGTHRAGGRRGTPRHRCIAGRATPIAGSVALLHRSRCRAAAPFPSQHAARLSAAPGRHARVWRCSAAACFERALGCTSRGGDPTSTIRARTGPVPEQEALHRRRA